MSLSRIQFYKNSIWTFLELTSYPLLVILSTPFFISKIGIEQYGLWMLINTITLGINVLNIGVGDTSISLISKFRANNNTDAIKKVFRFNFSFAIFLCLAAALLGGIFYSSNFIALFYKKENLAFAGLLLFLGCVSVGIKFIEIAILSVFKAFERFDINSKLQCLSKCSVIITALLLCSFGEGLISILISGIIVNLFNIGIQLFCLFRFKHELLQWPDLQFLKHRTDYLKYNLWYWLQSSIALFGFLTDKLAVAWFADVKTMGYYYIASMIGTNIHNFFLSFGAFIFPRASYELQAKNNIFPLYFVSRAIIAIIGWLIILGLILGGDFLFQLWLGPETYLQSIFFIKLYLVFEAGMLLIITPFYFNNSSHLIKLNSLFEILIRSSHFIFMLLGHYYYGINGILYGLILSTFINIPFQYYTFHKLILNIRNFSWLLVLLPVAFLLAYIISTSNVFKLIYLVTFFISIKFIYFDAAKPYIANFGIFRKVKSPI
ncbi:MAG: hypothetical protein WCR21_10930 [Bacteroidota bacterium]